MVALHQACLVPAADSKQRIQPARSEAMSGSSARGAFIDVPTQLSDMLHHAGA